MSGPAVPSIRDYVWQAAERIARRWGAGTPVTIDLTKQPRKDCPISLQNHGGYTWFRNIRIRRLN